MSLALSALKKQRAAEEGDKRSVQNTKVSSETAKCPRTFGEYCGYVGSSTGAILAYRNWRGQGAAPAIADWRDFGTTPYDYHAH